MFEIEQKQGANRGLPFLRYAIKEVKASKSFGILYYIEDDGGYYMELGKNIFHTDKEAADKIFEIYNAVVAVIKESQDEILETYYD